MDKPLKKNFNIRRFAEAYISNALDLGRVSLSQEAFYQGLFYSVAGDMGIGEEHVVRLHHAFHWYLFNRNSESVLEVTKPQTNKEVARVRLGEGIGVDKKALLAGFLKEHQSYLEQRVRTLQQS